MNQSQIVFEKNGSGIKRFLSIAFIFVILPALVQAQAPTATTGAASDIGTYVATVNGTVNANGSSTTVTFEYGLDDSYGGTFAADQSPVSGSTSTAVSATISELEANTTYHYRVAAVNASGTTYGADMTFTTLDLPPAAPAAETNEATNLGADGATLNGLVFGRGENTDVTFEYGEDTNYGTTVTADESPLIDPFYNFNFPVRTTISGLTNNTTYHYRVVATNINGTTYGADVIFTLGTVGTAPTVTTDAASGISSFGATMNGTVNANESLTTVIFEYGLDTNYVDSFLADQSPVSGSSDTPVSTALSELEPNTLYHYRVVAWNANDTTNGLDMTFTTLAAPPTAATNTASAIGPETATLNGTVNANGASATVTFEYGSDTNYGTTVAAVQSPVTGVSDTPVSTNISGLTEGLTYHFRVAATNVSGTTYGTDMSFTAGVIPPAATTGAATDVSTNGATLHGNINANDASTEVTFEYGRDTNYGRMVAAVPATVTGSSDTAVTANIEDLLPNTTYHFRVVGVNAGGIAYGADMSFITGGGPLVTTNAADSVGLSGAILNGVVNANNENTTVTFEYGLTMAYGTTVTADQSPVTGNTNTAVSKTITDLTSSTTYHYRVVGQNASGTSYGVNQSFTTAAADPNAPTAVTNPPTIVSATGASLSGAVDAKNQSTIIIFEYGLTAAYGDTVPADQSPLIAEFPIGVGASISDLISDTTYHYRVVAQNAYGMAYGSDITFFTSPSGPPAATTDTASSVSTSGAILNATVNANNSFIVVINFEYGLSESYGTTVEADPRTVSGIFDSAVSQTITGLANNTTYHYRVAVRVGFVFTYGSDMTFTTGQTAPTITTDPATDIDSTSATLNATVNANNTTVTASFEFGPDTNYGRVAGADQNPVTGNTDSTVSTTLADLQPNTTYHYRAVGQNTDNTVYGTDMTFTTGGALPAATTNGATAVSDTGATLNGMVRANNDNTTVTFEYGLTDEYGSMQEADQNPLNGNISTAVSTAITGLSGNTTYHYRVVAQNSSGTTNGLDQTFFTGAAAPAAITGDATAISNTSATLNGTVIANNAATSVFFEYGGDTSYGRTVDANPNLLSGSINTEVYSMLTGLLPGATYHFRLVATNSVGTTNGADETFTTSLVDDIDSDQAKNSVPTEYAMAQNYPNPFNPTTIIEFALPKTEYVELKVYNLLGNEVTTLVSKKLSQGIYRYQFDGKDLAGGVYFYQLVAGDFREVKKLILIK